MDRIEDTKLQLSGYTRSQTDKNKVQSGETSKENEAAGNTVNSNIDESYVYRLPRKFVRIEYPGLVKNLDKALETLGGIYNIEMAIADPSRKLDLRLHPDNKFNKPCFAERDTNPGLLIKVMKIDGKISYEILGYSFQNFKFNKAIDFQYLPLTQDTRTGNVEYVHDKIFPKKLPNLDYLNSKENASQPKMLLPCSFCRFETSHNTLYLKADEKFNLNLNDRPELFRIFDKKPADKYPYRQISYLLNINDPTLEIPENPNKVAMKLVKEKLLEDVYQQVNQLFKERPIWTKAAIQHRTGISNDQTKILLPANAYFWNSGPWRMTWTRFGFDPRKDFSNRIYQTLDFRIRAKEGTKIKVKAKRKYMKDNFTLQPFEPRKNREVDESHYILSPNVTPPARQMFYQYCDIKIPEIQEMLQRLPKTAGSQKFNTKTGWLPVNFSEQCREIANRYVIEHVHKQLLEDSIKLQSKQSTSQEKDSEDEEEASKDQKNPLAYSSRMLNVMKEGFKRSIDMQKITGTVILSDDDSGDDMEQVDVDDVVNSIPANMDDISDGDDLSEDSEMELDMETVEEINQLISKTKQEVENDQ